MAEPAVEPGPVLVAAFDVEGPLPDLAASELYRKAWVVACRNRMPLAVVEIDLTQPRNQIHEQLKGLRALPGSRNSLKEFDEAALPSVSVVVPSIIARLDELERCLSTLDELHYPDFEIILVDNRREVGEDDALPALVARRAHVRVVREPRPGISAARNAGTAAATGEIVVFTDDDVHVDRDRLTAFGRRFLEDPRLDAVTGLILPAELESPAQIYFERYYGGFSGERTFAPLTISAGRGTLGRARVVVRDAAGEPVRQFALYGIGAYGAGANMAFRRDLLLARGGFDLALGTGTPARGGEDLAALIDVLWSGGSIGYEPAAVVYHKHRRELSELERQLDGNGVGFTAMLTSLVRHDPGHLVGLGAQLPLAAQRLAVQSTKRLRGKGAQDGQVDEPAQFPSNLVLTELRGMVKGPLAYWRSQRATQRWSTRERGSSPKSSGLQRGLVLLAHDARLAAEHLLLTTLGGSVLLPGTVRRLIYTAAGAAAQSAPGIGFFFGGSPRNLTVGRNVYMNARVYIEAVAPVHIGSDVALGMDVMILTSHHEIDERGRWAEEATGRAVSIGDRVWIGARATILPGASVDPDVIIAAGAVVTGHCRSHGVYGGVPARRIRDFDGTPRNS